MLTLLSMYKLDVSLQTSKTTYENIFVRPRYRSNDVEAVRQLTFYKTYKTPKHIGHIETAVI
jgi:hypothetical protein